MVWSTEGNVLGRNPHHSDQSSPHVRGMHTGQWLERRKEAVVTRASFQTREGCWIFSAFLSGGEIRVGHILTFMEIIKLISLIEFLASTVKGH